MDVLITTVGVSLIMHALQHAQQFTPEDVACINAHINDEVACDELTAVLMRIASHVRRHPDVLMHTREVQSLRMYVERMTRHVGIILPKTDYILLSKNTVCGRFCAEQLKSALCAHMIDIEVCVMFIHGMHLHTTDALSQARDALCNTLDHIHRHYKSDVIYNVSGEFALFAGFIYSYTSKRGARIIYTFDDHSPLVISDVPATGVIADISFYQDVSSVA